LSQKRRRHAIEEEPMLFDLPLAAPGPADRPSRRPAAGPIQVDLFTAVAEEALEEEIERGAAEEADEPDEIESAESRHPHVVSPPDAHSVPVVAGVFTRFLAGCADVVLHLGALGGAYLGVLALDVEPRLDDWPAFALLLVAFSFLSSVVSLAFWPSGARPRAWRGAGCRLAIGCSGRSPSGRRRCDGPVD
jgi:hypothetical protein